MQCFRCLVLLSVLTLAACGGGNTSSSGPTAFAGIYNGSVSVSGITLPLKITITSSGFVVLEVAGGVVCAGDLPSSIGLDGDDFSSTTTEECIVGGFRCPVNTSVSGSVAGETITGSGQILLGCPGAPIQPVVFSFIAIEQT